VVDVSTSVRIGRNGVEMYTMWQKWAVGAGSGVIYQHEDDGEPPTLTLLSGDGLLTLVPPSDRAEYQQLSKFLCELREAAESMALHCHPAGSWGRQVFGADVTGP
jgi:hypothetical protein